MPKFIFHYSIFRKNWFVCLCPHCPHILCLPFITPCWPLVHVTHIPLMTTFNTSFPPSWCLLQFDSLHLLWHIYIHSLKIRIHIQERTFLFRHVFHPLVSVLYFIFFIVDLLKAILDKLHNKKIPKVDSKLY